MGDFDLLLRADNARPFDHVAKLADVPWPSVVEQRAACLFAEATRRAAVLFDEACQEAIGQRQDVFATLTQRRQVQSNDIQTVEQVFTETPVTDHVFQIQVRGGEDAHVCAAGDRVADALVFFVLNEAQQLGLQRQREVPDFVEEQCTAVGLIHSAQRAFAGARER
nr:hypothetical protein [Tanacetum cinerariifolium]